MATGGAGEVDIDAVVTNTGQIQVQRGTLSLNGGGSSTAGGLIVSSGATLRFGSAPGGGGPATFAVTSGFYSVGATEVTGSTLDLSAASGAGFTTSLAISGGGAIKLGSLYSTAANFSLGVDAAGGTLSGSSNFIVTGLASFGTGLLTGGGGVVVLADYTTLNGTLSVDGNRTVQNAGTLDWTGGSIALASGDASLSTHHGYLNNVAGGVFQIETDGTISGALVHFAI